MGPLAAEMRCGCLEVKPRVAAHQPGSKKGSNLEAGGKLLYSSSSRQMTEEERRGEEKEGEVESDSSLNIDVRLMPSARSTRRERDEPRREKTRDATSP